MSYSTKQDKTRNIVDLIQRFGERVSENPETNERVYDLRGAARVIARQQGMRVEFQILARGAEIRTSTWRGQIEQAAFIRGGETAFDRIWRNATRIGERMQAAREEERNAQIRAAYQARETARLNR